MPVLGISQHQEKYTNYFAKGILDFGYCMEQWEKMRTCAMTPTPHTHYDISLFVVNGNADTDFGSLIFHAHLHFRTAKRELGAVESLGFVGAYCVNGGRV